MEKEKAFCGIDPGKTGSLAIITPDGVDIMDWGETHEIVMQLKEWHEDYSLLVYIEKVHAMPKQGVVSTFNFGVNFGMWQGILYALGIPHYFVPPQVWQKKFLSVSNEPTTKKKSLEVARRLYPSIATKYLKRQKDHNRADSLLIATYAKTYQIRV